MKKIICCFLLMSLLLGMLGSLSGCKEGSGNEGTDTVRLTLIDRGVSNYIIVYPAMATKAEREAAELLRSKIHELTGIRLKSDTEEFLKKEDGAHYIYIGNTTFEPAIAAKEEISKEYFDAYEADAVGGDIYFVGASMEALVNAVKHYTEKLAEYYDKAGNTLQFAGFHFNGETVAPTGFSARNIREYAIVYASGWLNIKNIAKELQQEIENRTGFEIGIYSDKEIPEGKYEILLGETNRALSARCYEGSARLMEYEFVVEQCKVQLVFGGCYSAEKCLSEFSKRLKTTTDNMWTTGSYYKKDYATETQELTSGSDVRIMSANILAYRWGEARYDNILPAAQRAEIFAGVLRNYSPDAVGVQEMDEPWNDAFPWYLERMAQKDGVEYTCLHNKATYNDNTMINFSTILYRSDLYKVDETGCRVFSIWEKTPSYYQRVASYVKLTAKDNSGKEFALVNTHWAHEDHETVNACAVEQAALVNELKAKYAGVTVFCTGDYNNLDTREWKDDYLNQMVADINGKIASQEAKSNGVLITPGGCRANGITNMREANPREIDDSFIDHIICSGGAWAVMRHDTIRANGCHVLSDHSMIYADVDLK